MTLSIICSESLGMWDLIESWLKDSLSLVFMLSDDPEEAMWPVI